MSDSIVALSQKTLWNVLHLKDVKKKDETFEEAAKRFFNMVNYDTKDRSARELVKDAIHLDKKMGLNGARQYCVKVFKNPFNFAAFNTSDET